ncbi:MAG: hypothetical protein HF975_15325 [ANME-2 cluster archaeon]|nr:hypothetical protein [ANME-2 cluster archaeon]MBC2709151.1 hypothetical protein [ANME-2 cluster archaeon]MBC2748339.1 hypothetical protein [ANME-2 cluster archaeon]
MTQKPTKNSTMPPSKTAMNKQVLDKVSTEHANEILKRLADEDAKISKRIEELALEYLMEVDPDGIAENVFCDLDILDVEDVWKNSGSTRYGYVDPYELAFEMFEEALEPYIDDLRKCQELSMDEKAKLHCMGILKGIDQFEREATTEFKDWAVDDPYENFIQVFEEWKNENMNPKNLEEMDEFIKINFPKWYRSVLEE